MYREGGKGRICCMDFFVGVFFFTIDRSLFKIFFWLLSVIKQVFFSVQCKGN